MDNLARNKHNGNKLKAWADVNVFHDRFILGDLGATITNNKKFGIKNYPGHVFCSVKAKTKHEMVVTEDSTGRKETKVVKLGMGPIQRAEIDYEFDTCFDLDKTVIDCHGQSRIHTLEGERFEKPGPEITKHFLEWLGTDDETVTE